MQEGKEEMKVDLTALFIKREPPMSPADCTEYREQWKENLETMSKYDRCLNVPVVVYV